MNKKETNIKSPREVQLADFWRKTAQRCFPGGPCRVKFIQLNPLSASFAPPLDN